MNVLAAVIISILTFSQVYLFEVNLVLTRVNYKCEVIKASNYLMKINYTLPTMTLCIGTPCQLLQIAITTESIQSFIFSSNDKLNIQGFNPTQSTSYKSLVNVVYATYQNILLKGITSTEKMCFLNSFAFPDTVQFSLRDLVIESTQEDFAGFIGMYKYNITKGSPLYVNRTIWSNMNYMFINGSTKTNSISIRYTNQGGKVYFGEDFSKEANYTKCDTDKQDTYWTCKFYSIGIGNEKMKIDNMFLFDSRFQLITAPIDQTKFIFEQIMSHAPGKCNIESAIMLCDKTLNFDDIPDVYLNGMESEYSLVIHIKNMFSSALIDHKVVYVSKLTSQSITINTWTIGIPGFMDNIIDFDNEKRVIGFIQIKKSTYKTISEDCDFSLYSLSKYIYISVIIFLLIGILIELFLKATNNIK